MSEPEQDEVAAPRLSKAMLGRILAVGFFVVLGTFAVIQSMRVASPNATNATVRLTPANPGSDGKIPEAPIGDTAAIVKDGVENPVNSLISNVSKIDDSKTTGFEPKQFTPPTGNLNKNATPPASQAFAGSTFGSSPANAFNPSKSFTPPDHQKNVSEIPVVTSQPIAKPPTRYAQVDSGIPIIGNNSGFGTLQESPSTKPPNVPSNSFGNNSVANPLNTAAKTTDDTAADLKSSVSNAASDLLRSASEKSASEKSAAAAGSLKPDLGGGFGPGIPKTTDAFSSPAAIQSKSAFDPPQLQPKVQSGFGDRPTASPEALQKLDSATAAKDENSGSGGAGNLQPVRPITSRLSNNGEATAPTNTNPFADSKPQLNTLTNQGQDVSVMQRSSVPVQPISSSLANIRRNPTSQPSPASPFGNDNTPDARLNDLNSRPGSNQSTPASNASLLTKNVPGDRQLDGIQAPALTVEKLSPREIQVNQIADFEIVVKNVGRMTAEDVHVFDAVPAGTEFKGATPEPARISQDQTLQWNLGQLRAGQEKRIKLQLKPIQPGEMGSVAQVTFAAQASMRTLVTKPVLEIVHQTNPTHLIGGDVVLDVVVTNKGDGPARNVMIQQDVPAQLEFPDGLPGGSRGIEYEVGTLMPGKSRRVKLALKAADIGKIQNVMYASADGGLRAEHRLPIEVVSPNLVATSEGPTRRFLKRDVTHQFSVTNKGTAKATNVELIARLPSGLRYLQSNNQGRYDANTHAVYWSLAELDRDIEAKVELKTMPVDVGNQPIRFESAADLNIRSSIEQALEVEHLVDVFFEIDDVVDPIEIGSDTSYRLRLVNQGTKAATNVQLQVEFPAGLQPTSVEGSLRHNIVGQQIAFEPINSMSPGDEIGIIIHGKGISAGDHRVIFNMRTDGRTTPVSKQESTRVYADQ